MGPQNGPTGSNQGPGFSWPIKMEKIWTRADPMGLFYLAAVAKPKGRACKRGHKFAEHSGQKGAGGS